MDHQNNKQTRTHQLERSHGVASAELHGRVDVSGRGIAPLEHLHRLLHVGHEQSVDNEAGRVLARDAHLVDVLDELHQVVEGGVVGAVEGAHNLHQLHHRHRVEEVKTTEAILRLHKLANLVARQRAGVGDEDDRAVVFELITTGKVV